MSEMVRRVARSYGCLEPEHCDQGRVDDFEPCSFCLEKAREALALIREPTDAMLVGARDWSRGFVGTPIGNAAATGCWQAMLKGALAED